MINAPRIPSPIPNLGRADTAPGAFRGLTSINSVDPEDVSDVLRRLSNRADPVHLYSIARNLGIGAIVLEDRLDRPGYVYWEAGQPIVKLRGGTRPARRRFALAHEMAHVILGHGNPSASWSKLTPQRIREDELLADSVAGRLLVPMTEVDTILTSSTADLDVVRKVADRQQVSLSVVVRRIADAAPTRPILMLELRRDQASWNTWRLIGSLPGLSRTIRVLPSQNERLDRLSETDTSFSILADIEGCLRTLIGTGNRRGSNVLMLVSAMD